MPSSTEIRDIDLSKVTINDLTIIKNVLNCSGTWNNKKDLCRLITNKLVQLSEESEDTSTDPSNPLTLNQVLDAINAAKNDIIESINDSRISLEDQRR